MVRWLAVGMLLSILAGCGSVHYSGWQGKHITYTVRKGETLYSIAERYGYDHREVAAWNRIRKPYHIYPGQRLTLIAPHRRYYTVKKGETLYSIAWRYGYDYREVAEWNRIKRPYNIYPGQRLVFGVPSRQPGTIPVAVAAASSGNAASTREAQARKSTSASKSSKRVEKRSERRQSKSVDWRWPTPGVIVAAFNPGDGKKGLDIRGKLGQSVNAAADGNVVYSGNGLIGYGNLLIIKHNDTYLSAYGHNRRLLVKEGSSVKQGQKIAEMGDSGKEGTILHFEIRRDGKPVNPLAYLPKRRN